MCGICGIYNYKDNRPVDGQVLDKMTDILSHRGPDDRGTYIDAGLGLGHRRLSIIDLASGRQPIPNEDNSVWIVFNGEIYNYRELREEMKGKGHIFRTSSDTEVIVHLYEEMREECVKRLNGIFAFCIWDAARRKIMLARDRLGVKPLLYSFFDDGIIFASEIKSILQHPAADRQIDPSALDDFFSLGYITAGKSIIRSVKSLAPATVLSVQKDRIRSESYWDISYANPISRKERHYSSGLLSRLEEAVRIQMVSDVPVGAFLSGGLDSSSVVSFMARERSDKIRTFSIGFLERSYDELSYARKASALFSTDHKDMPVNPDIGGILPKLVWHYDEPFADTSTIPTYFLCKLAASSLKVVLSGDGGDENFYGYPTYVADKLAGYYNALPGFIKALVSSAAGRVPVSFDKLSFECKLKRFVHGADNPLLKAHYLWRMVYSEEEKQGLYSYDLKESLAGYSPYHAFEELYNSAVNGTVQQRLSYVDFKTWLADDILRKLDRASMANSLEARVPLLDHELVEFASNIPDELKLRKLQTKYIFKRAMEGRLPREIIYREKSGFSSPVSHWISAELRSFVLERLNNDKLKKLGYFQVPFVEQMFNEHFNRVKDNGLKIWSLLNFVLWHDIFIQGHSV